MTALTKTTHKVNRTKAMTMDQGALLMVIVVLLMLAMLGGVCAHAILTAKVPGV